MVEPAPLSSALPLSRNQAHALGDIEEQGALLRDLCHVQSKAVTRGVGGREEVAVTAKKAAKKAIRARMAATGEKYTEARRAELGELSITVRRGRDRVAVFDRTLYSNLGGHHWIGGAAGVEIAWQLHRLGVDVVEAGFPEPDGSGVPATMARQFRDGGPVVCALASSTVDSVDSAWRAIEDAAWPRLHVYVPFEAAVYNEEKVGGWTRALVAHAKAKTGDVEFTPCTWPEIDPIAAEVEIALEEGATTINLAEMKLPVRELIPALYERVPALADAVLSVECSNRRGMALAESMDALAIGARQVKCSMHGWTGHNAALEALAMNLHPHFQRLSPEKTGGLWTGIDVRELVATSELVAQMKGYEVPADQPFVGSNVIDPEPLPMFEEQVARADSDRALLKLLARPIPAWLDEWPSAADGR
jgi:hypothetical protein